MGLKKIILTGGGTGGSVTPLLALVSDFKNESWEVAWIGTNNGIEKNLVINKKIPYYSIASGKFRRYFSIQNIIDPFFVLYAFFQSILLLSHLKPSLVMSAGGFVSVPVVWAAWCLRIPVIIHQQDIRPGLANRLMSACASIITVTFEKSLQDYNSKAVWTGNPVRPEFINALSAQVDNKPALPMILILGGGTGSEAINKLVSSSLSVLTKHFVVIHSTGEEVSEKIQPIINYQPHTFLEANAMAIAMKQSRLVITRAGLGTLTELAYLSKPAIIIPMPNSHQEDNAYYFQEKGAGIVLSQEACTPEIFIDTVITVVSDSAVLENLSESISTIIKPGAQEKILTLVRDLIAK